jgi:DNA helicase-2/ATP-dependent DNA helicase PcrA
MLAINNVNCVNLTESNDINEGHDSHLDGLNTDQLAIVHAIGKPIIVIAGAGTGKTKAIVAKIKHYVINNIVESNQIVAVTFTNKAAGELRHRLSSVSPGIRIGTFHRISMDMLYDLQSTCDNLPEHIRNIKHSAILTGEEQLLIVKQILQKRGIKASAYSYLQDIQAVKECGRMIKSMDEQQIFDEYEAELLRIRMFDFSDLLLKLVQLWECRRDTLDLCRAAIKMLCVDEYQDINDLQFKWIKLLYNADMHLCCVGDADQSIYGFRGANIHHILNFNKTFNNSVLMKLEENYRSKKDILDKANLLVRHNKNRIDKTLRAHHQSDDKGVHLHHYSSDLDEADGIARHITDRNAHGTIAILIREKLQAQRIEAALMKNQIVYTMTGVYNFMDRAEVKDILAYLKFAINPHDAISFKRAMLSPRRGIGEITIRNIIKTATDHEININTAAREMHKPQIDEFIDMIDYIRMSPDTVGNILKYIYDKSQYAASVEQAKDVILREWFDTLCGITSVTDYLASVLWQEYAQDQSTAVNLMTIHASKGLEFDYVFLPGWEEGIMPHALSRTDVEVEEERRLAYVAITRARHGVFISHTRQRMQHGKIYQPEQSRFVREAFNIKRQSSIPSMNQYGSAGHNAHRNRSDNQASYNRKTNDAHNYSHKSDTLSSAQYKANNLQNNYNLQNNSLEGSAQNTHSQPSDPQRILFKQGDMVMHNIHGIGLVLECSSSNSRVQFVKNITIVGVAELRKI